MSAARQQELLATSPAGFKLLEWRPLRTTTSTLIGHVLVEMPSGMVVPDIPVFRKGPSTISVGVPSKPLVDANGVQLRDREGKRRYAPTLDFASSAARSRWSSAVVELLVAAGIGVSE